MGPSAEPPMDPSQTQGRSPTPAWTPTPIPPWKSDGRLNLLLVGGDDLGVIELNEAAYAHLGCEKKLAIIPGATHLFEEPGTLEQAAKAASNWFTAHGGQ